MLFDGCLPRRNRQTQGGGLANSDGHVQSKVDGAVLEMMRRSNHFATPSPPLSFSTSICSTTRKSKSRSRRDFAACISKPWPKNSSPTSTAAIRLRDILSPPPSTWREPTRYWPAMWERGMGPVGGEQSVTPEQAQQQARRLGRRASGSLMAMCIAAYISEQSKMDGAVLEMMRRCNHFATPSPPPRPKSPRPQKNFPIVGPNSFLRNNFIRKTKPR